MFQISVLYGQKEIFRGKTAHEQREKVKTCQTPVFFSRQATQPHPTIKKEYRERGGHDFWR
jgi:hypothetical protein